ncbi:hypothetical protein [Lysinibacillus agricola]|uniref:hypothetical protein n=1 Tax=Lysinibacillus agricola TaxID=2590012 RepID=UPI001FE6E7C3|nr:hypothetical protein [Lysinibacillus agricola]
MDNLLPFLEIQQQCLLNNGCHEVISVIKTEDTDQVLLDLLHKKASIKQLIPINQKEEQFRTHF